MRYFDKEDFDKANMFGQGAKKDSWFSHISLEVPGENTSNEWLEPVSDMEYEAL